MDLVWLGGMLFWGVACVVVNDFVLLPYGIPPQDWHVGVMIAGGLATFIWPWWGLGSSGGPSPSACLRRLLMS
jgi:hypothetical protein